MRHWVGATWWDLADKLDLMICDSGPSGCRKKWTPFIHKRGRVDQMGVVHWDGFNRRASINGLYSFMVWAAFAKNRAYRNEPAWLGLYHASVWAYQETVAMFSIQIPWSYSEKNRKEVLRLARKAGVSLMNTNSNAFYWVHWKPKRVRMERKKGGAM